MRRSVLVAVAGLLAVCLSAFAVQAQVPTQISYQGRLLDASDVPVNGSVAMTFRVFEESSGGTELWSETHPVVEVTDGYFSVTLGSVTPISADLLAAGSGGGGGGGAVYVRYLETQVGADSPISPRTLLVAAPYAVASSRLAGDVSTSPGELHVSDLSGSTTATIRVSNDPGSNGSELVAVNDFNGDGLPDLVARVAADSTAEVYLDDDSDGDQVSDARVRLSVRDAFGNPSSSMDMLTDFDSDGVPDVAVTAVCGVSSADMAIKTKGTGADKDRVTQVISEVDDSTAMVASSIDLDGDGVPEIGGECAAKENRSMLKQYFETGSIPTQEQFSRVLDATGVHTSSVVDLDGDGNSEARVTSVVASATPLPGIEPLSVSLRCDNDSDDDGLSDADAEMRVTPTTSSLAIKTKGTGAQRLHAGGDCDDTDASWYVDSDDDGDGVPENSMIAFAQTGSCGVAIKTKGTGADRNRVISSTTDELHAVHALDCDDDNDGVIDRSVSSSVDDSASVVSASDGGVSVSFGTRKGWDGTIKGTTKFVSDIDNDGLVESSIALECDSSSAQMVFFGKKGYDYYAYSNSSGARMLIENDVNDTTIDIDGDGHIGVGKSSSSTRAIDVAGGAYCDGANWVNASDVNAKENFQPVDGAAILRQLAALEVTRWNYKGAPQTEHIGPTAQDFQAVFGVGSDGKSISTIDPAGIALAAAKELTLQLREKSAKIEELEGKIQQLQALVERLAAQQN